MNPKCLGRDFPDTSSARSAHLTGFKMRRITRAASSVPCHGYGAAVRFVCRIFRVSWSGRRILGADLKCSESGTWAAAASCRAQQAPGPKVALRRKLLFLDKRTLAFAQGLGRLFSRNAPENLVVVPFCLGFARRLNFDEIHVVRHAAVPAHSPFGEEIVDRQLPYLICDRPSIYRPRCLHRPEIVQHR